MHRLFPALALGLALLLGSCASDTLSQVQLDQRRLEIQNEPRGDYYIGRRYYIERTQFWGYLRRPGQSWDEAKLVLMNENRKLTPDRLAEVPTGDGPAHGFDHNREYKITGHYSGRKLYDPNSDLFLPEFILTGWEVRRESPGWLFNPREKYDGSHLLRMERQD